MTDGIYAEIARGYKKEWVLPKTVIGRIRLI